MTVSNSILPDFLHGIYLNDCNIIFGKNSKKVLQYPMSSNNLSTRLMKIFLNPEMLFGYGYLMLGYYICFCSFLENLSNIIAQKY